MSKPKQTIIVTGGAGFIGSHLVDTLINLGHSVIIYDNLSTGKKENLNPKAKFVKTDLIDPVKFPKADSVFHLAALPRIERSFDHPKKTHDANVTATVNVLKATSDAGIKRFVYSSSSSVYGKINNQDLPVKESHPCKPESPYAAQKRMSEIYVQVLGKMYLIDTVILRYFNVYGPRMPTTGAYKLVIPIFLEQKKQGHPLTIYGDGKQTRDFTHVTDVITASILAVKRKKNFKGEIINIGSGHPTSINQLADIIGGKTKHVIPNPRAQWEERFKSADTLKARTMLHWNSRVTIEQGLTYFLKREMNRSK